MTATASNHRVDQLVLSQLKTAQIEIQDILDDYADPAMALRRAEYGLRKTMLLLKAARSSILHSGDY